MSTSYATSYDKKPPILSGPADELLLVIIRAFDLAMHYVLQRFKYRGYILSGYSGETVKPGITE